MILPKKNRIKMLKQMNYENDPENQYGISKKLFIDLLNDNLLQQKTLNEYFKLKYSSDITDKEVIQTIRDLELVRDKQDITKHLLNVYSQLKTTETTIHNLHEIIYKDEDIYHIKDIKTTNRKKGIKYGKRKPKTK